MITLTETASNKVRSLIEMQNKSDQGYGLRVFIQGGGCAGFQYGFDLDNKQKETDNVIECHGVKVFLDRKSALYLIGSEIDYEETMMQSGFKVSNPNSESSCGCGISFSVDPSTINFES